ncbi:hypothetical protein [Haloarcula sp. CGMCC 1.2071]|uniref:hypothetical protein n=1 Tax=Haloarcula sp. CGMCC 1.2071 TaxID=3111454 RepID=UPI00300F2311
MMRAALIALLLVSMTGSAVAAPGSGVAPDLGESVALQEAGNSPTPTVTEVRTAEPVEQVSTETATESEQEDEEEDIGSVVARVDSRLRVTSYSYNSTAEVMTVSLRNTGDRRSEVTITEVVSTDTKGSSTFGIQRADIRRGGEVEVEVSASRVEGRAGVMVTTAESVEDGKGSLLVERRDRSIFNGGADWSDVRSGVLSAIIGSLLVTVLGVWYYVAQRHEEVAEVDLDADGPSIGGGSDR